MSDDTPKLPSPDDIHILSMTDFSEQVESLVPRISKAAQTWADAEDVKINAVFGAALAYLGLWLVCASVLGADARTEILATLLSAAERIGAKERARIGVTALPDTGGLPN